MSIAGGLPLAVRRAAVHKCEALQIFTRSTNQWRARAIPEAEVRAFRAEAAAALPGPAVSHASYLINLAAVQPALRKRSIEAFGDELGRAERLGLTGVVIHPGSATDCTPEEGVRLVADAIAEVLAATPRGTTMVLLEGTAGQGRSLGSSFEQLAAMLDRVGGDPRVGFCLDTCHLHAAGYDLVSPDGYERTLGHFDDLIGLSRLRVVHLNDSTRPLGSRVDRHAHIGRGTLGRETFRRLLGDSRLRHLPMILETPKSEGRGPTWVGRDPFDQRNLAVLRRLMAPSDRAAIATVPAPRRTPRLRT